MKTRKDPRHIERIKVMQELFAWGFNKSADVSSQPSDIEGSTSTTLSEDSGGVKASQNEHSSSYRNDMHSKSFREIVENVGEIDGMIAESAPAWPIEKINKVDLAILRQAVYELVFSKDVPTKVVADEAVELAKEYGSDQSASFVNGALGKIISGHKID